MKNFYFTFATSPNFSYKNGYLIVKANSAIEAIRKFRAKYHDIEDNYINCSFYYTEEEWNTITCDMGICHEIIE